MAATADYIFPLILDCGLSRAHSPINLIIDSLKNRSAVSATTGHSFVDLELGLGLGLTWRDMNQQPLLFFTHYFWDLHSCCIGQ